MEGDGLHKGFIVGSVDLKIFELRFHQAHNIYAPADKGNEHGNWRRSGVQHPGQLFSRKLQLVKKRTEYRTNQKSGA